MRLSTIKYNSNFKYKEKDRIFNPRKSLLYRIETKTPTKYKQKNKSLYRRKGSDWVSLSRIPIITEGVWFQNPAFFGNQENIDLLLEPHFYSTPSSCLGHRGGSDHRKVFRKFTRKISFRSGSLVQEPRRRLRPRDPWILNERFGLVPSGSCIQSKQFPRLHQLSVIVIQPSPVNSRFLDTA